MQMPRRFITRESGVGAQMRGVQGGRKRVKGNATGFFAEGNDGGGNERRGEEDTKYAERQGEREGKIIEGEIPSLQMVSDAVFGGERRR